ncbi:conserved hypothetical protein [Nitrospira sp. ND1]|uniref:hypothetical protein n=1 Tax=Nitrospira sp. ND1 TaxID=1658518 RepID=UPI0009B9998C|nr:hypothetical protein [Nitrospira sp. ND1]SLM43276.1 conserved hypothetical protein [Nitrospira sp. ND1]
MKETDAEKLALLHERFCDVCLVEKEVWTEIYMPRTFKDGTAVRTNLQDKYDVIIDDQAVEDALEANIPLGKAALSAAIQEYRTHVTFVKKA